MFTVDALPAPAADPPRTPQFAGWPVGLVAAVTGALMYLASRNYGYFFDEAYFVVAGRDHLAWGYFDQPALVPALAALADHLAPGSLPVLRLPATLACVGGVVLTALIARELGGGRRAQTAAAFAYALSGAVRIGHWLATYSLDPFFWTVIVWLLVRWTRQHREGRPDDRLLLAAGAVTALSLQTKFLVPALWAAVLLAAVALGPRTLPRRPLLWVGALIAVVATTPNLVWQVANGWPYARMTDVVAKEFAGTGRYLWEGLAGAGLLMGVLLVLCGLARLVVSRELAAFRYLGVATIAIVVAFALLDGRSYYLFSLYALPIAAGATALERFRWTTPRALVAGAVVLLSLAVSVISLPVFSRAVAEKLPDLPLVATAKQYTVAEGQLEPLVDGIAALYTALPPEQRARTAIMTDSYVFAAAVDLYGPARDLPRAYSGHRGYFYFGHPDDHHDSVLFVGTPNPALHTAFTAEIPLAPDFATLYTGLHEPWDALWPDLRTQ
ncbi:glycosyltransferase family 39 protein [Actinokineospora auranticolor]|uniref:Dolichyl-phosphate-mannose-protein mannosyltransferase n=1 Tax=Actinokineospora auranticolor TaxID=155976 RepID=A0A2S6GTD5_9PSEU|nr:glycosyltransferase family 39 protein [Actinokineospora auranticolor]PPK68502.1 dolichyl-phosphate-mannose-protein mannosyltransferase [Actinokineospora auranticolor]